MDRQHTDRETVGDRQAEPDNKTLKQAKRHVQSGRQKARRLGKEADIQIPIGGKKDRQSRYTNRKIIRLIAG